MIFYLGVNVGLAAVMLFAVAVLRATQRKAATIAFRTQLFMARVLLGATFVTTIGAIWVVKGTGLSWSFGGDTLAAGESSLAITGAMLSDAVVAGITAWAAFMTLRTVLAYRALAAVLRDSVVLRRHGRVRIVASDHIDVPCSIRTLKTRWVVVPSYLLGEPRDLRLAVSHELQHHRHGDTAWAWWSHALTIVCWPNPVVHLWRRWQDGVQELACDEALLEQRSFAAADYARCLLNVAEHALNERRVFRFAPSMAARRATQLQTRIEMLFASADRRGSRALMALTLVLAVCLGIGTSGLTAGLAADPKSERVPAAIADTEGNIELGEHNWTTTEDDCPEHELESPKEGQ